MKLEKIDGGRDFRWCLRFGFGLTCFYVTTKNLEEGGGWISLEGEPETVDLKLILFCIDTALRDFKNCSKWWLMQTATKQRLCFWGITRFLYLEKRIQEIAEKNVFSVLVVILIWWRAASYRHSWGCSSWWRLMDPSAFIWSSEYPQGCLFGEAFSSALFVKGSAKLFLF